MAIKILAGIAAIIWLAGFGHHDAQAQGDLFGGVKDLLDKVGDQPIDLTVPTEEDASGSGNTSATSAIQQSSLTDREIGSGLREALQIGTERVVDRLGRTDGFNLDPEIHIPLPKTLASVQSALKTVGMSTLVDDLELRLNRAAEIATPKAKELFWQAIEQMTLSDVRTILNGPDNAATEYFRGKMSHPLAEAMHPVVDESLGEAGAVQAYDRMMGRYKTIPFVPDAKADLTTYVLEKGIDGIFYYIGKEEAAIRRDPVKRSTDLLRRVFGAV
jgi:hypothetical protein